MVMATSVTSLSPNTDNKAKNFAVGATFPAAEVPCGRRAWEQALGRRSNPDEAYGSPVLFYTGGHKNEVRIEVMPSWA